jgi:hypothetical protein
MTDVRLANIGDTDRIVDLMRDAHLASPSAKFTDYAPDKVRSYVLQRLSSSDSLCLVYDVGDVQGVFIAITGEHPMHNLRLAVEAVSWVAPAQRGHAWSTIRRWFESWANEKGCHLASLSSKEDDRFARAIERNGYALVESHFVKVL